MAESKRKNDFTYWLTFGLSPNLGLGETLGERLVQKWSDPVSVQYTPVCVWQFLPASYTASCPRQQVVYQTGKNDQIAVYNISWHVYFLLHIIVIKITKIKLWNSTIQLHIKIIIITNLYSAFRSEDTEALDAAQEDWVWIDGFSSGVWKWECFPTVECQQVESYRWMEHQQKKHDGPVRCVDLMAVTTMSVTVGTIHYHTVPSPCIQRLLGVINIIYIKIIEFEMIAWLYWTLECFLYRTTVNVQ